MSATHLIEKASPARWHEHVEDRPCECCLSVKPPDWPNNDNSLVMEPWRSSGSPLLPGQLLGWLKGKQLKPTRPYFSFLKNLPLTLLICLLCEWFLENQLQWKRLTHVAIPVTMTRTRYDLGTQCCPRIFSRFSHHIEAWLGSVHTVEKWEVRAISRLCINPSVWFSVLGFCPFSLGETF